MNLAYVLYLLNHLILDFRVSVTDVGGQRLQSGQTEVQKPRGDRGLGGFLVDIQTDSVIQSDTV